MNLCMNMSPCAQARESYDAGLVPVCIEFRSRLICSIAGGQTGHCCDTDVWPRARQGLSGPAASTTSIRKQQTPQAKGCNLP